MAKKDYHENLLRFYEFQLGKLPKREFFKQALQNTFTEDDLRIFFLLPFLGMMPQSKFEARALKAGIPTEQLHASLKRLQPEGLVDSLQKPGQERVYGRSPLIALIEFQVRLKDDSPMREASTIIMNAMIEGATEVMPTRTPYYRVLPVEATLTGKKETLPVEINIPDPRQVLPIDVISEMVRKEEVIALSDCYCRATKKLVGEDCGHPLETCFYFGDLGLLKLETGYARRIDYEEAMGILYECEKAGLVHNVSNCEGQIQTLCNCCACSCGVIKGLNRGAKNIAAPARYTSVLAREKCTVCGECVPVCPVDVFSISDGRLQYAEGKCIGCGQCVRVCPEGALHMELRERSPKIFKNNDALFRRINMEAMIGLAGRKLLGR